MLRRCYEEDRSAILPSPKSIVSTFSLLSLIAIRTRQCTISARPFQKSTSSDAGVARDGRELRSSVVSSHDEEEKGCCGWSTASLRPPLLPQMTLLPSKCIVCGTKTASPLYSISRVAKMSCQRLFHSAIWAVLGVCVNKTVMGEG